ncbi:MAG: hypothetical protein A3F70_06900 [Acidobacteria bacterium RIFCSPLOWO2_12_FULL_67_14]|nr:MAG: hypothetical protein A3H29_18395 [Acidobacteria bacterium RIFCSPLOWO2_02_FULL_67_21]OFW36921.1 MAG: hypothetical protein A3F70_06900 [Acidobacteria bacterium RIFCSPLOWO2_12_FULL_67_14]
MLAAAAACRAAPPPTDAGPAADPLAESAEQVRLVGHHDLQGRESLVVTALSDAANGRWVYVGHHESYWDGKPKMNDITGGMEWNGTSIVDVADPARPRLVWHIPNDSNRNSRGVSVVYDYTFDGSGRDYLIRNSEALTQGETGNDLKYQIFDITDRATNPSAISLVAEITGTPPNSCGPGCGGRFRMRAHKGWWSQETGYFYAASGEPGFRNVVIQIFDLRNPRQPSFVGRAWLPGLKDGEPGYEGQYSHHPVVDEPQQRLYVGYRNAGGQIASFDISDPARPRLVWSLDMNPPFRGPHTVSPILYEQVPNFGPGALPRTYAFVVDEASGEADTTPCAHGVRAASYMVDITTEARPMPVSVWQVPVGDYCTRGGRFGPHQSAETVNGRLNRFENKVAWLAYFNAGVRVVDLSNPYSIREIGHYIPKPNANAHPIAMNQPVMIQMNDVDLDDRGLAYASDRVGSGLYVLEYTGD